MRREGAGCGDRLIERHAARGGRWIAAFVLTVVVGHAAQALAGPAFNRPPRLVDADGRVIGTVVGVSAGTWTVLRRVRSESERLTVQLDFDSYGGWNLGSSWLLYETADCTGTAYLDVHELAPSLVRPASIDWSHSPPQQAYYAGDPAAEKLIRSVRSDPSSGCYPRGPQTYFAGPVRWIDLTPFVPPFRVD